MISSTYILLVVNEGASVVVEPALKRLLLEINVYDRTGLIWVVWKNPQIRGRMNLAYFSGLVGHFMKKFIRGAIEIEREESFVPS